MHLEEIPPSQINASQWEWMKSYRVWEANRKVFLYPENWIEPELRDDKTPFFKELEAALQQDEVTSENVEAALLQYLTKLEGVANLEICGLYWDEPGDVVHVFGRTYNSPDEYFYRRLEHQTVWKAWEKVSVDIESAEDGEHRGAHLAPVVWNRRLYLFWPVFGELASPADNPPQSGTGKTVETKLQVKLAWSEYPQGKWQPKQVSQESLTFPKDYLYRTAGMAGYHPAFYAIKAVPLGPDLYVCLYEQLQWNDDRAGTGGTRPVRYRHTIQRFHAAGCPPPSRSWPSSTKPRPRPLDPSADELMPPTMLVAPTGAHAIFTTFEGGGPQLEMPSGDVLAWPPKVVNLEMQPIFNQTAGNFRVVYPHQYNQFLLQAPFFYQDARGRTSCIHKWTRLIPSLRWERRRLLSS